MLFFKILDYYLKKQFENVAFALEVIDTPRVEIRRRVRATLELVGLEDKVNAFPTNYQVVNNKQLHR